MHVVELRRMLCRWTARAASLVLSFMLASPSFAATTVDAIEFYNASLDHYFVTVNPDEISKLDTGVLVGWQRTGLNFKVIDPAAPTAGDTPVCRFYGTPAAGLDSHFYSASPTECNEVAQKFPTAWIPESPNVFRVFLPNTATGACPAGSIPVYRAWNKRIDSNHRYTTDPNVMSTMLARGYVAEGYGTGALPVAMCAPGAGAGAAPACSISASPSSATVGSSVLLSANCDGTPTSFTWTGCSSSGPTCVASSSVSGTANYTVIATNAFGNSVPSTASVNWTPVFVPPAPACTAFQVTSTSPTPVIGSSIAIATACTNNPIAYMWTGCNGSFTTCNVQSSVPGPQTYTVVASNAGGSSAPASVTVNWSSSAQTPPGFCGQFPSYLYTRVGTSSIQSNSRDYPVPPGFAANGVWVEQFTIPSTASGGQIGRLTLAEFDGPPTVREATLSLTPCDFRPTDPSGTNGPIARGNGIGVTQLFSVGAPVPGVPQLSAGATYYFNVRNANADGSVSCGAARCEAFIYDVLPQ
jgi:hypothetical protein